MNKPTDDSGNATIADSIRNSELKEGLGCNHEWEQRQGRYGIFYLCSQCEMELSVDQYSCVQQSFKAGYEACKEQAIEIIKAADWGHVDYEATFNEIETNVFFMQPKP